VVYVPFLVNCMTKVILWPVFIFKGISGGGDIMACGCCFLSHGGN
jgi:hypothetical protein